MPTRGRGALSTMVCRWDVVERSTSSSLSSSLSSCRPIRGSGGDDRPNCVYSHTSINVKPRQSCRHAFPLVHNSVTLTFDLKGQCMLRPYRCPLVALQYVTVCTSGFVDDVLFSFNGPYGGVTLAQQRHMLCTG